MLERDYGLSYRFTGTYCIYYRCRNTAAAPLEPPLPGLLNRRLLPYACRRPLKLQRLPPPLLPLMRCSHVYRRLALPCCTLAEGRTLISILSTLAGWLPNLIRTVPLQNHSKLGSIIVRAIDRFLWPQCTEVRIEELGG